MYTPMHSAASSGQISVVKLLLEMGAELDAVDIHGNTPLHIACLNGQDVVVGELVAHGAVLDALNLNAQVSTSV
jgi:serine/threonine-protein phosphatase 6 regulatory ankyrin repeat subunit A